MDRSGFVQQLNNHYQRLRLAPQTFIQYTPAVTLGKDECSVTVTLRNYNPPAQYTGRAIGKQAAKEAAARAALQALGMAG